MDVVFSREQADDHGRIHHNKYTKVLISTKYSFAHHLRSQILQLRTDLIKYTSKQQHASMSPQYYVPLHSTHLARHEVQWLGCPPRLSPLDQGPRFYSLRGWSANKTKYRSWWICNLLRTFHLDWGPESPQPSCTWRLITASGCICSSKLIYQFGEAWRTQRWDWLCNEQQQSYRSLK